MKEIDKIYESLLFSIPQNNLGIEYKYGFQHGITLFKKMIDNLTVSSNFCLNCETDMRGDKMKISEKKMQIVIDNYFKSECDVNTSIRQAFEKGFRIGVKKVSSAEPERKKGKWIEFPNHMAYKCSECGRIIQNTDGRRNVSKHYPFCHCGADMRGEQDG